MKHLADYEFEWVLPGHGRRYQAEAKEMHQHMEKCISWMESVA